MRRRGGGAGGGCDLGPRAVLDCLESRIPSLPAVAVVEISVYGKTFHHGGQSAKPGGRMCIQSRQPCAGMAFQASLLRSRKSGALFLGCPVCS